MAFRLGMIVFNTAGSPARGLCALGRTMRVLVLDEQHEVHIVLASDDEYALAGVTVGFRCSRISSRSPRSMWKTMSSKPIPRSALSFAFFAYRIAMRKHRTPYDADRFAAAVIPIGA